MDKKPHTIIIWIIIGLVVIGGFYFFMQRESAPGALDAFAACLEEKGAIFYGAFWCPHCQSQKSLFGSSERLLPYIECSTPDGRGQRAVCQQKNIQGYPTWEFADGTREEGEVSLDTLSEKTGCPLPPSFN